MGCRDAAASGLADDDVHPPVVRRAASVADQHGAPVMPLSQPRCAQFGQPMSRSVRVSGDEGNDDGKDAPLTLRDAVGLDTVAGTARKHHIPSLDHMKALAIDIRVFELIGA